MTRTERLLRLARQRGDRAAELILSGRGAWCNQHERAEVVEAVYIPGTDIPMDRHRAVPWTEAELREAWGK